MELTYNVFENHLRILKQVKIDSQAKKRYYHEAGSFRAARVYNEKASRTQERIDEIKKYLKKD